MKKRIADKWIRALRSGKYKQGDKVLCNIKPYGNAEFCCLGVLDYIHTNQYDYESALNDGEYSLYSGLGARKDHSDLKIGKRTYPSLADANDNGVSFKKIAAYIAKHYKDL